MKKQGINYKWVAAVLAALAFDAYAQTSVERTLEPVVVTASRVEQLQKDTIAHTTVITSEQIKKNGSSDIRTVLSREAGIQITQNGGAGSVTGLFLRGADTRQTLVLIDGIPMTKQDASGAVSIEQIQLDQIDHIEVVRGNVSAIYGSGAIGGVIQIFTKTGKGPAQFTATAEVGPRSSQKAVAGVSGKTGDVSYALTLSKVRTNGFSAINTQLQPKANPDNDGYDNKSASGMLAYDIAKGHQVGVRFLKSDGTTQYDSAFATPTQTQTQYVKNDMYSVFSKNRITANWQSNLTYSTFKDDYLAVEGTSRSAYVTKTNQLQWANDVQLNNDWTLTGGAEHRQEKVDTVPSFGSGINKDRNLTGLFSGALGQVGNHQLQANVRHDKYSDVGNANTYYLGYGYNVTERLKATVAQSTAFSAAPLGYLFAPGYGNPNLKPEKVKTQEIGLQYASDEGLLKTTLFQSESREQFDFDMNTFKFGNIARVQNTGLEVSYVGKLLGNDFRSSLTMQDPKNKATDATLSRRAKVLAAIGLSRDFGALTLGGDVSYTGPRKDGTRDLEPYSLTNLYARYKVSKQLAAYARLENAFNKVYQTAYGYNQAPRGLFIGLNATY